MNLFCSDVPLSSSQIIQLGTRKVLHYPIEVGAIAVVFNVAGISDLNLNADSLSLIFQRNVTMWNDPLLVSLNPQLSSISQSISVVRRQESSGSTQLLTRYLSESSNLWKMGISSNPTWVSGTIARSGSDGVSFAVSNISYSIGYTAISSAACKRNI